MFAASKSGRAATGGGTDPDFEYVTALPEPIANSIKNTTVTDSSAVPLTFTRSPTATNTISTGLTSPYQTNGYWSNYFSGGAALSNSAISTMNFGASTNFTIETFINWPAAAAGNQTYIELTGTQRMILGRSTTGLRAFWNGTERGAAYTFNLSTWYHIAIVRNSGTVYFYVNGVVLTSFTDTVTWSNITLLTVGKNSDAVEFMTGYVSNLRVVNGTAVYTGTSTTVPNFTVPTSPLTIAPTTTALLTCQGNRFRDISASNYPLTVVGTPQVLSSFYPSTFTAPAASIGAGLFPSTSNYLVATASPITSTTTTFTIECWVYSDDLSTGGSQTATVGDMQATGTVTYLCFGVEPTSKNVRLYWFDGSVKTATGNTVLNLNSWNHIAVSVNANAISLFVNGVSQTITGTSTLTNRSGTTGLWTIAQNNNGAAYYKGYISNLRVVNGVAVYSSSFTPPIDFLQTSGAASAASYPSTSGVNITFAASSTTLLLNLADSNSVAAASGGNNNVFIDSSNNGFNITRVSTGVNQGSLNPYWPTGYWSNYVVSSTDYVNIPTSANFAFPGAFTVEGWFYWTALPPTGLMNGGLSNNSFGMYTNGAYIGLNIFGVGNIVTTSFFPSIGVWHHVAITRNASNICNIYIDGISAATATSAHSFAQAAWVIYNCSGVGGSSYISNYRVVKGVAVYSGTSTTVANFTVPTSPLSRIQSASTNIAALSGSETALLTCQNNSFKDNSLSLLGVTTTGVPRTQTFSPFTPPASYSPAVYGGSGYFNGGSYLTASSPILTLPGTWTIECWFYSTVATSAANQTIVSLNAGANLGINIWKNTSNQLVIDDGSTAQTAFSTTIFLSGWNHVAVVRVGTTTTGYINGAVAGTNTFTPGATNAVWIARYFNNAGPQYYTGYISNLRIVNNTAVYTGAFTPPSLSQLTVAGSTSAASYPSTSNVNTSFAGSNTLLLANFTNAAVYDAAMQSNLFTGTSFVTNATSPTPKWTPLSMKFDGTANSFISIPEETNIFVATDLATTSNLAWTIECWVYYTGANAVQYVVSRGGNPGATNPSYVFYVGSGTGYFGVATSTGSGTPGTSYEIYYAAGSIPASTWVHWAATRTATGVISTYINGVWKGSSSAGINIYNINNNSFSLGCTNTFYGVGSVLTGAIQDFRITKGIARYTGTGSFTPPTAAFPTR
jgi:hypothetical protein